MLLVSAPAIVSGSGYNCFLSAGGFQRAFCNVPNGYVNSAVNWWAPFLRWRARDPSGALLATVPFTHDSAHTEDAYRPMTVKLAQRYRARALNTSFGRGKL
jgi:hypothetical protein